MRYSARVGSLAGMLLMALVATVACASKAPAPAAPAAQSMKLRLVSTKWLPFTGAEGEPRVALTLTERALERAGYDSATTFVANGELSSKLQHGDYDGSAALWKSPEREQFLLYSKPYFENRLVLVARKGENVAAGSFADLKGKRVALVDGYAYGEAVDSAVGPQFVRGSNAQQNLQALLAGNVDYALLEDLVVEYLFEQYPKDATDRLEVGKVPLVMRSLHLAVRRDRPDAKRLLERFNAAIAAMVGDGSYNVALQLAWIRADVDGDGKYELIPRGDHLGSKPPDRSYELFTPAAQAAPTAGTCPEPHEEPLRFFIGGKYYDTWQEVPEKLRGEPEPNYVSGGKTPLLTVPW